MTRRTRKGRRGPGAGEAMVALPALSSLSDVPAFEDLSASEAQRLAFERSRVRLDGEGVPPEELRLGCVVRLDRGFPAVATERGLLRAEFAAQLTKGAFSQVAVGDWVCVRVPAGHEMGIIQEILPREGALVRWRGGARGERQTLAANVDVVLVAQALGAGAFSVDRLARSAVVVRDCGARVAIVLTKADRVGADGLFDVLSRIRDVLGEGVSVVVTCAQPVGDETNLLDHVGRARTMGAAWGMDGVRAAVPTGAVGIVLGESGAGKSTLLNALLGRDSLETGAVRTRDDAGRHTTVARRMVRLPEGGVIVDAPGLRSLPLVGHERGLALVFPEIVEAAGGCRFRDCTHTHEPGCSVREGLADGRFSQARLDAYLALAREMRASASMLDPDVVL